MLSPEQIERKVAAIFGKPWGRLKDEQYRLLYGGIDSKDANWVDPTAPGLVLDRQV